MTREKAKAFVDAVVTMRMGATDEVAITAVDVYPEWDGAGVDYTAGDRVLYNEILYKVLTDHTSQEDWAPDVAPSLFTVVLIPDSNVIPAWVQPDSTNPYMTGDKVTHNDYIWQSDVDNNVWEPGVYGWTQLEEADISDAEALSIIAEGE